MTFWRRFIDKPRVCIQRMPLLKDRDGIVKLCHYRTDFCIIIWRHLSADNKALLVWARRSSLVASTYTGATIEIHYCSE